MHVLALREPVVVPTQRASRAAIDAHDVGGVQARRHGAQAGRLRHTAAAATGTEEHSAHSSLRCGFEGLSACGTIAYAREARVAPAATAAIPVPIAAVIDAVREDPEGKLRRDGYEEAALISGREAVEIALEHGPCPDDGCGCVGGASIELLGKLQEGEGMDEVGWGQRE